MKNFLNNVKLSAGIGAVLLCVSTVPAQAAPVITVVNADLTASPYTFSYQGSSFTFGSTGDIFGPLSVRTSGDAAISSFFGSPSSFFIDRGTVAFGPDQFGSYSSFPATTQVPFSNGNNFLGLRVTSGGQNFYGFAFTTNTVLNSIGFEQTAETTITATAAVPEPATWAMLILGFGLVGGAMRYRRREVRAVCE